MNLLRILSECGLGILSEIDRKDLASALQKSLEGHVGAVLVPMLSEDQLEEFERAYGESNDEAALAVLRGAVPEYEKVVQEQVALLKAELRARREEILNVVGLNETEDHG